MTPVQPAMPRELDVLVASCGRPAALAATLTALAAQSAPGFGVFVSDQSPVAPAYADPAVQAVLRVLRWRGHPVRADRHLPARGMAEQRAHLLTLARSPYVLFLDDDVVLEPTTVARLLAAIDSLGCGFVGAAAQGLSYLDDERADEQVQFERWTEPVHPERIRKGDPAWERWRLHNAANLLHVEASLGLDPGEWCAYKVAWVGGCVLYDRAALIGAGGYDFWRDLPANHRGEDVVAQLRVMERRGGAGILPSGAVHLELPTTLVDRQVDAYQRMFEPRSASVPA